MELLEWAAQYYHHPLGEVIAAALPKLAREGAASRALTERWFATAAGIAALDANALKRAPRQRELLEALRRADGVDQRCARPNSSSDWRTPMRALVARGFASSAEDRRTPPAEASAPTLVRGTGPALERRAGGRGRGHRRRARALRALPAVRHHRQRQDRGLSARGRARAAPRPARAGAGAGDRPHAAARRPLPRTLRRAGGGAAFRAHRHRTPRRLAPVRVGRGAHRARHALRGVRADRRSRPRHRRRGTRRLVQAARKRLSLFGARSRHPARAARRRARRARLRDALARNPAERGDAESSRACRCRGAPARRCRRAPRSSICASTPCAQGISTPAVEAMQRHLADDGQVLVFINRRGYSPTLACTACGWIAPCRDCDARLTVHLGAARLRCHHCGADAPLPENCPQCGYARQTRGPGHRARRGNADRSCFPDMPIARLDRDVVRKRGDLEAVVSRIASGEARILVGTQMVTKGHDFPNVTLVVVLNADQGLFSTDFRAPERVAQTIIQVAGRAGRGTKPGEVLIQTEYPGPSAAARACSTKATTASRARRSPNAQAADWPPFAHVAALRASATALAPAIEFLRAARQLARARRAISSCWARRRPRWPSARRVITRSCCIEARERAPLHRLLGGMAAARGGAQDAARTALVAGHGSARAVLAYRRLLRIPAAPCCALLSPSASSAAPSHARLDGPQDRRRQCASSPAASRPPAARRRVGGRNLPVGAGAAREARGPRAAQRRSCGNSCRRAP